MCVGFFSVPTTNRVRETLQQFWPVISLSLFSLPFFPISLALSLVFDTVFSRCSLTLALRFLQRVASRRNKTKQNNLTVTDIDGKSSITLAVGQTEDWDIIVANCNTTTAKNKISGNHQYYYYYCRCRKLLPHYICKRECLVRLKIYGEGGVEHRQRWISKICCC